VEGFSESLSKEVRPLRVKVTSIESGGFRTDFAGSSLSLRKSLPEDQSTVGATVGFQPDDNGKHPGDLLKAVQALLHVVSFSEQPVRLLLGSDSSSRLKRGNSKKFECNQQWAI
jgi:NAD(P)-dependent dehydrogenase (short-subunit alcohol dehydrogenase family)